MANVSIPRLGIAPTYHTRLGIVSFAPLEARYSRTTRMSRDHHGGEICTTGVVTREFYSSAAMRGICTYEEV